MSRRTPSRSAFWRFNWIAHHQMIMAVERSAAHVRGRLLDVGCGTMPGRKWLAGHFTEYMGVDLADSRYLGDARLTAVARAEALPFRGGTFDTVLGLSMLTYLPEPGHMVAEAWRALRAGGVLVLEFTQTAPLHDPPHDYFRFTRFGARWLLERHGFEVLEIIPVGGLWTRVAMSLIAPLNRINRGPARVLTELPVRLLYVVIQLAAALMDRVFRDPNEALAHVVVARRVERPATIPV
jgi:SAM-dependent methyltransferase